MNGLKLFDGVYLYLSIELCVLGPIACSFSCLFVVLCFFEMMHCLYTVLYISALYTAHFDVLGWGCLQLGFRICCMICHWKYSVHYQYGYYFMYFLKQHRTYVEFCAKYVGLWKYFDEGMFQEMRISKNSTKASVGDNNQGKSSMSMLKKIVDQPGEGSKPHFMLCSINVSQLPF